MSIKRLFDKKQHKSQQAISKKAVSDEVEALHQRSGDDAKQDTYVDSYKVLQERYYPKVDFLTASNFAKFGLAEEYYKNSIERVYKTYPYDGSGHEKNIWMNSSSFLDKYIFDQKYPRTNGYIKFHHQAATLDSGSAGDDYTLLDPVEYVLMKGGPHKDNVYNALRSRESNLKIDGATGNTVEFWLKKKAFNPTGNNGKNETVLDVWSTGSVSGSAAYGRLSVVLSGSKIGTSPIRVTYMSGAGNTAGGFGNIAIGSAVTTASVADNKWHHYAISFKNSGDAVNAKLYIDGEFNHSITSGSVAVTEVQGALAGTVGSLITAPSGTALPATPGWGKLSASLDEFRFWKAERTHKDIKRHWYTQVPGGANTLVATASLGVYYKFNEGITTYSDQDAVVLDYSGRLTNGAWTGYATGGRVTGSAIMESSASATEFKDPIIYSGHPDVKTLISELTASGMQWDYQNVSSIHNSIPAWLLEADEEKENYALRKLLQTVASYFDTLYLQISGLTGLKDPVYTNYSGSEKQSPFADRLVRSAGMITPEIFANAEVLEQIAARSEERIYEDDISTVKNLIYQNIYNNLVYIYKSKGTEKAFRNLIRCFGVDDEILRLNLYSNNVTYEIKDTYRTRITKNRAVNFNHPDRFDGTVYQQTASSNTNSVNFISGSTNASHIPITMETEIVFPKKTTDASYAFSDTPFVTASLFGMHTTAEVAANLAEILDTTGGQSNNDRFTINVPTTVGGTGDDITIRVVAPADPSDGTANEVQVGLSSTANTRNRIVLAINGLDSSVVQYGAGSGDVTNGIAGITAVAGTGNTLTITATTTGVTGNNITFTDVAGTMVAAGSNGASPAKLISGSSSDQIKWHATDSANFQVYAVRDKILSDDVYFKFTSSVLPTLTSSLIYNVYDDEKWNLAVRLKSSKYPLAHGVSGSSAETYDVEFYGVNTVMDSVQNEFLVTASCTNAIGKSFLSSSKRVYGGSYRTNFTGAMLQRTDIKLAGLRYWMSYLDDEEIKAHARDIDNKGAMHPLQGAYLFEQGTHLSGSTRISKTDTLILDWDFVQVTGSGASSDGGSGTQDAKFLVEDISSGSVAARDARFGWLGDVVKNQHTGRGDFFLPEKTDVVEKIYIPTAKQRSMDELDSSDMVQIRSRDDDLFTRDSSPIQFYFAIEKSMYQTISEEMLNMFATIKDFNNLVGAPVNRYRMEYKELNKLRQLFFARVKNTPEIEKYINFYKWIDTTISVLLQQLVPASANMSANVSTVVESHVLERNKYFNKFPTAKFGGSSPVGGTYGINRHLYNWKFGHPVPARAASFGNILDTDGGQSNNDRFTVNVPTIIGGTGGDITIRVVAPADPSDGTANEVQVGLSSTATTRNRIVDAINGLDSSVVQYGAGSGDVTNGIAGISAAAGTTDTTITITAHGPSATGNETVFTDVAGTMVAGGANGSSPAKLAGGTGLLQDKNCFWWKHRAIRRSGSLSGSNHVNKDKDSIRAAIYQPIERDFTKTYRFKIDELSRPSFVTDNKRYDYIRSYASFQTSGSLDIPASSLVKNKDCADTEFDVTSNDYRPINKTQYGFKATDTEGVTFRGDIVTPFSIYSASISLSGGYKDYLTTNFTGGVDFVGLHFDGPKFDRASLQGPFTETHVGGLTFRHVPLNVSGSGKGLNGLDFAHSSSAIGVGPGAVAATLAGILDTDGGQSNNDRFTVNVPSSVGGAAADITIRVVAPADPSDGTANEVQVGLSSTTTTRNRIVDAINGLDSSVVKYGAGSGDVTNGVAGISASAGATDTTITVTAVTSGVDGNSITFTDVGGTMVAGGANGSSPATLADGSGVNLSSANSFTASARVEGWRIDFTNNTASVKGPEIGHLRNRWAAPARYYRDEVAKRPVNVRNIPHLTKSVLNYAGSGSSPPPWSRLGNFQKNYQVVQTSGRIFNNLSLIKSGGFQATNIASGYVTGVFDYRLPARKKNKTVIVERFNAPGGPDVTPELAMNIESGEYAPLNALPWRNLMVRMPLQTLLTERSELHGYRSGSTYGTSASFHKINRNPAIRYVYASVTGTSNPAAGWNAPVTKYETRKSYDNWYVQHPIPQSDLAYQWITSSYDSSKTVSFATSSSDITFSPSSHVTSSTGAAKSTTTFTVADGDAASGMSELESVAIISVDGTKKKYVIVDDHVTAVATGDILLAGSDIGSVDSLPTSGSATIAVADGDAASGMSELEYITLISTDSTTKKYVIVDDVTTTVATGDILVEGSDYGSAVLASGAASIDGIAVAINLTGGSLSTQNDYLVQLKAAIEHANGHNGKITVSAVPTEANGSQSIKVWQREQGDAGSTAITKDISQLTIADGLGTGTAGFLSGDRFFGGIAVAINIASSAATQNDYLGQLTGAINHANGHNGKIAVSAVPAQADGNQSITLTQNSLNYTSGDTAVTSDITNLTVADFSGGTAGLVVDYVGINTLIYDPVNTATGTTEHNLLGFDSFAATTVAKWQNYEQTFAADEGSTSDGSTAMTIGWTSGPTVSEAWSDAGNTAPGGGTYYASASGWTSTSGSTRSSNTGPNVASSNSSGLGNYYMYCETSYPNYPNKLFSLVTPEIDASIVQTGLSASFWYHMFGATIGTLKVQHCKNKSFADLNTTTLDTMWGSDSVYNSPVTYTTAKQLNGQQQLSSSAAFRQAKINLVQYAGTRFYLRLLYKSGQSYTGDCAIDQIKVTMSGSGVKTIDAYKNTSIGTLSSSRGTPMPSSASNPDVFNALMLHRNGPYGYPSWKQIRTGEHPVARYHRKNNIMSIALPPKDKED